MSFISFSFKARQARPGAGHPRLPFNREKDVDGRVKPGHDENDSF
jgi:hypothetical protein